MSDVNTWIRGKYHKCRYMQLFQNLAKHPYTDIKPTLVLHNCSNFCTWTTTILCIYLIFNIFQFTAKPTQFWSPHKHAQTHAAWIHCLSHTCMAVLSHGLCIYTQSRVTPLNDARFSNRKYKLRYKIIFYNFMIISNNYINQANDQTKVTSMKINGQLF